MNIKHTPGPWGIYQNAICTDDGKANEIAKITRHGVWMGDGTPYGQRNPITARSYLGTIEIVSEGGVIVDRKFHNLLEN